MKEIETILDECIEQMHSGASLDEVLERHPDHAAELRELLALSVDLAALPDPAPSIGGLMRAMSRQIASEPLATPASSKITFFSRPVLTRVAASIAAMFILGWSTTIASSNAVPGDFFYPLKLVTEKVRFALTVNPEDKAELRIIFSERRLKEAVKKYNRGEGIDPKLLSEMLDEAARALDSFSELPDESSELVAARVLSSTRYQEESLKRLRTKASPRDQKALEPYLDMCAQRCEWMKERKNTPRSWSDCASSEGDRSCPW